MVVLALSGAAALGHQLLWTRRLADIIGSTGDSNARVFGCFFLGLSLGAAAASWLMPRLRRPWRAAGCIELGIALLSLPALSINDWSAPLWPMLGPDRLLDWQGALLKTVLSVTVVLPPALLAGMTLPVVIAAVCMHRSPSPPAEEGATAIWLYASGTLGGALGLVFVVGVTLHWLGGAGSMLLMMGVNATAAGLCFLADYMWRPEPANAPQKESPMVASSSNGLLGSRPLLLLSFLSGAGVLGIEVLGMQLINLKAHVAFYTPAAILFCIVLLLACSAAIVAKTVRHAEKSAPALIAAFSTAGLAVAMAPLVFLWITSGRSGIGAHGLGFAQSMLQLGAITCFSLGPGVLFAGTVFPLLMTCIPSANTHLANITFSRLLAINGLGGLLGAEFSHRFLGPWLGVHVALGVLGAVYILIAAVLSLTFRRTSVPQLALPAGSMAVVILLLFTSLRSTPIFLRDKTFNLVELRSGREGTLAVAERFDVGRAMFLDNHYMLGCSAGTADMQRQAHVPLLLHPDPRRVCFIALGTGITASGALRHRAVESVEAIELSPLVAAAAARRFGQFNQELFLDPKIRVRVEDARVYLAATPGRLDVIVGDLFVPWRPGEARLWSVEQFTAARAALRPGGVFCQWLPLTQLTPEHFEIIAATFRQVFGEIYLFQNKFQGPSLPVALVGFKDTKMDWQTIGRRCDDERQYGRLHDPLCRHEEGLALLYLGTYRPAEHATPRLNTLDNLWLELDASRHLISGNRLGYFDATSDLWLQLVEAQLTALRSDRDLPAALRALPRIGQVLSRWQFAHQSGESGAADLHSQVVSCLPSAILKDPGADWSLWPGTDPRLNTP